MFVYPTPVTLYRKIPDEKIHTVSSGETLNGIAIKYETSSSAIQERNNMESTAIFIGQKLTIPAKPGAYKKTDYGKFLHEAKEIKVALSLRENVVKDRDGAEIKTFMDVDFPPNIEYDYGDELEYKDQFNRTYRGIVISLEENTDPLGIRVLSRFSNIGYQ